MNQKIKAVPKKTGPESVKYRMVNWDAIMTVDEIKLVVRAMCMELGFNESNPFFKDLLDKGLLGEEKTVDNFGTIPTITQ